MIRKSPRKSLCVQFSDGSRWRVTLEPDGIRFHMFRHRGTSDAFVTYADAMRRSLPAPRSKHGDQLTLAQATAQLAVTMATAPIEQLRAAAKR